MIRAHVSKVGRKWSVRAMGQGKATAKVATLGDAKRTGDALAQQTLLWERQSGRYWIGREMTAEERERLDETYRLARADG